MIDHCAMFQLWKSVKISPGLYNVAKLTAVSWKALCFRWRRPLRGGTVVSFVFFFLGGGRFGGRFRGVYLE